MFSFLELLVLQYKTYVVHKIFSPKICFNLRFHLYFLGLCYSRDRLHKECIDYDENVCNNNFMNIL